MKKFVIILSISFLFNSQINNHLDSDNITDFLMGEYYFLSSEFDLAHQYYSSIEHDINFESSIIFSSIAEANLEIGNLNKALEYLIKSYDINKQNDDLAVLIYNLHIILGNFNQAESFLIEACFVNKSSIFLLDILYQHFLNTEKLIESIEVLADMYKLDYIDNSIIIKKSILIYEKFNNQKLIIDILDSHYSKYNDIEFIKLKFIFSNLFNDFNNLKKSYDLLKLNEKVNIDQTVIFCQKLFTKKDFQKTFNLLKPYYKNNQISFDGLKLLSYSTLELNLLDDFLDISKFTYKHYSDNPISHEIFVTALIENKQLHQALEIVKISSQKFPKYYNLDLLQGRAHELNKDYNKAIILYSDILSQDSNLINIKYNLAKIYNKVGNYKECDNLFLDLINIDSENIIFLNDFAHIISNRLISTNKELNYAMQLIEYALKIDNNNPILLDTYGWINYKLGNYSIALEYINQSLSIHHNSIVADHLIEILKSINKLDVLNKTEFQNLDVK